MNTKKIIVLAMAALGLSNNTNAMANDGTANDRYVNHEVKILLGSQKESHTSVYGGPNNRISSKLYGTITDELTGEPLAGVKVFLYDEKYLKGSGVTDEKGTFYVEDLGVWAGVGVEYTVIAVDPQKKYKSAKMQIKFDMWQYNKKQDIRLTPKNKPKEKTNEKPKE